MAVAHRISPLYVTVVTQARRASARCSYPRLAAIDIARGTAMLFVCLSHFAATYLASAQSRVRDLVITASMVATPTFVVISGMTVGCLGAMYPAQLPHLRRLLLDRGLFLLTAGHLLLACALVESHALGRAMAMGFDTDAIGIAIIVGPSLVGRVSASTRAVIAGALYVVNWAAIALWSPHSAVLTQFKLYGIGFLPGTASAAPAAVFPVVPWFAVYLLGTVLGEQLGGHFRRGEHVEARRRLFRSAIAAAAAGLALYVLRPRLIFAAAGSNAALLAQFLSPTSKLPPGLSYLLYFGGAGLLAVWVMLHVDASGRASWLIRVLRNVGEASLVVFILQEYEYWTLLGRLSLPYTRCWPVLYLLSLVPLCLVASVWCRFDGNRLLTVGLRRGLPSPGVFAMLRGSLTSQGEPCAPASVPSISLLLARSAKRSRTKSDRSAAE